MKNIPQYTNAVLEEKVTNTLRTDFEANISWMDFTYGIAREHIGKFNEDEKTYPGVYENNGKTYTYPIVPDSKGLKGFCFFELSDSQFSDEISNSVPENVYELSVICWANMKFITPALTYDFSKNLKNDVYIRLLKNKAYDISTNEASNPFSKYSLYSEQETQFLMFPYTAFKFDFKINDYEQQCYAMYS